ESRNPGGCAGCPFADGKLATPVQLGREMLQIPVVDASAPPDEQAKNGAETAASQTEHTAEAPQTEQTPVIRLLEELNAQYAWIENQAQIYRLRNKKFIEPERFKLQLAKCPPVLIAFGNEAPKPIPLASAWIKWHGRRDHLDVVYEPGKPPVHENNIN